MEKQAKKVKLDGVTSSSVKLIVDDERFEVCRETLAAESLYFASLFSHDFRDSNLSEYNVHYDFSTSVFKDFVDWMNEDYTIINKETYTKPCLLKYISSRIEDLIALLRISSIYAVDNLTNDLIDIVVLYHYVPVKLIPVWIAAKELGVVALEDTCQAAFLEKEWEIPDEQTSLLHCDKNIINLKPKIPCLVAYKENEEIGKRPFIYCWDGNKVTELTEIKIMKTDADGCLTKRLGFIGMQIIGADFSIYAVGGEQGFESGRYNNDIWRYSLITKKWYYLTRLRAPRRHMVAAIVCNKLVVVGGVGRHRCKLFSVDVLKLNDPEGVDTTPWETAAETPETFTEVPLHCVAFGKLFILKSMLHVYCPTANVWTSFRLDPQSLGMIYMCAEPCIALHQGSIYVCKRIAINANPKHKVKTFALHTHSWRSPILGSDYSQNLVLQFDGSFQKLERVFDTAECKNKHDVIISDGRKLYSFTFCEDNIVVEMFEEFPDPRHRVVYSGHVPDTCELKPSMGYFPVMNPSVLRL